LGGWGGGRIFALLGQILSEILLKILYTINSKKIVENLTKKSPKSQLMHVDENSVTFPPRVSI
jgi:hypothetical protein